jgi:1-acyl-sn-glycerol-3-phosphate acyltransferase
MIAETIGGVCRLMTGATEQHGAPGLDPEPRVYFANHASHLDFVLIWAALPPSVRACVRPVAGRDYWDGSPVRRFMSQRVFHAVLVDRASAGHRAAPARASIATLIAALDAGDSLIVFPEGTRSIDGAIGAFRSGLYYLSRARPDVALVPVLVENTHRVLPKGQAIPLPARCRVRFGAPVAGAAGEDKRAFLARARGALVAMGDRDDRRH